MEEIKTLYWTHGSSKRGILALTEESIIIYHTSTKLFHKSKSLRDNLKGIVNLKDIVRIEPNFKFLSGNLLNIKLTEEAADKLLQKDHFPMTGLLSKKRTLMFEVNIDSSEEINIFVDRVRYNRGKKKKKQTF